MIEDQNIRPEENPDASSMMPQGTEGSTTENSESSSEVGVVEEDFDWSIGNDYQLPYSEEEKQALLEKYTQTIRTFSEGDVVKGKILGLTKSHAIVDINYKSNGLVPLSEFDDMPDLKPGDEVDVYIERLEDPKGRLILSRRKARLIKAWEMIKRAYETGEIIRGKIISKTKGGLIVDVGGLETFLPGSQIDVKPIIDYDSYVGKTMEFKVVKINEAIFNAVVSHKAIIESELAEQREKIIRELEIGQVLEGTVKNITDFGAFLDLGGVDGLLYKTDISWVRISHPSEVLELNQKLNVVVLDYDEEKKRISLGLKQLQPHPWDLLPEDYKEGKIVKGKVVKIEDYGAFVEVQPGVEGLIHLSEVSWSNKPINAREYFQKGQEVEAKIIAINREDRRMSLSIKQLTEDPWNKVDEKYPVGSVHKGKVINLTPYNVIVELEEGIIGSVHVNDLSWIKRFHHPSEYVNVGDELDVIVLEIDKERRKLILGHKQLTENPWDTFEEVFAEGTSHEATILRMERNGAVVQLPYGVEGFVPQNHLRKEDKSYPEEGETIPVKVIEFNRENRRIILSHLRYWEDKKKEELGEAAEQERKEVEKVLKQQKKETTVLGELGVFEDIKKKLVEEEPAKAESEQVEAKQEESKEAKEEKEVPKESVGEKATASEESAEVDDLKKIEGIGPKISQILQEAGIRTYRDLANTDPEKIREILLQAGSRYKMHDPTTWPEQAALAAEGKWDELKALQEQLKGGRKK